MLPEWVSTVAVGLGGAMLGAAAAIRKSGPEAESIASQTLRSVIKELRAELSRREQEWDIERDRNKAEAAEMHEKIDKLERNLTILSDPDNPPGHLS